eukprot:3008772-Amphidinium_carterae.1
MRTAWPCQLKRVNGGCLWAVAYQTSARSSCLPMRACTMTGQPNSWSADVTSSRVVPMGTPCSRKWSSSRSDLFWSVRLPSSPRSNPRASPITAQGQRMPTPVADLHRPLWPGSEAVAARTVASSSSMGVRGRAAHTSEKPAACGKPSVSEGRANNDCRPDAPMSFSASC